MSNKFSLAVKTTAFAMLAFSSILAEAGFLDDLKSMAGKAASVIREAGDGARDTQGQPADVATSHDRRSTTAERTREGNSENPAGNRTEAGYANQALSQSEETSSKSPLTSEYTEKKLPGGGPATSALIRLTYQGVTIELPFSHLKKPRNTDWGGMRLRFDESSNDPTKSVHTKRLNNIFGLSPDDFDKPYKGRKLADIRIRLGGSELISSLWALKSFYQGRGPAYVEYSFGGGQSNNGSFELGPIMEALAAGGGGALTISNSVAPSFDTQGPLAFDISGLIRSAQDEPQPSKPTAPVNVAAYVEKLPADVRNVELRLMTAATQALIDKGDSHRYVDSDCTRAVLPYYISKIVEEKHITLAQRREKLVQNLRKNDLSESAKTMYEKMLADVDSVMQNEDEMQASAYDSARLRMSADGGVCMRYDIVAQDQYGNCQKRKSRDRNLPTNYCECMRSEIQAWFEAGKAKDGYSSRSISEANRDANFQCNPSLSRLKRKR